MLLSTLNVVLRILDYLYTTIYFCTLIYTYTALPVFYLLCSSIYCVLHFRWHWPPSYFIQPVYNNSIDFIWFLLLCPMTTKNMSSC